MRGGGTVRFGAAAFLLTLAGALATCPAPAAQPSASGPGARAALPSLDVVGTTPLQGSGIDRDKMPAASQTLTADDIGRAGYPSTLGALDDELGGVSLDAAQNNPFQPNVLYRGFEASPLAGDAQGLAVYVDGTRFNQSFGDTVNWDLIPDIAVDRIDLVGSNPAYGLNALGGALAVRLKDGFTYHGGEAELFGGAFGRVQGSLQYGMQAGNVAAYIAGTGLHEHGWRDHSPSDVGQLYSDLGWRGEKAELHLKLGFADTDLTGNGTSPVELLRREREAVFTYPDNTRNRYGHAALTGSYDLDDRTSLQANAYYTRLSQRTKNGDAAEAEPCDADPTLVCTEDGDPYTDRAGAPIPNFVTGSPYVAQFPEFAEGGPYAFLNRTATDTDGFGAAVQATRQGAVFGRLNHLVVGAGYDGGRTKFSASSALGALTLKRGFGGPGIVVDQADGSISPVRVDAAQDYYGVFVTDTLDATSALSVTASGRFNLARIELKDRIGTALNGEHTFHRFNPGIGLTYRFLPALTAYAGYAEANRAPTPAELSCADAAAPCSLTNFFVGDPPLRQVVAHTFEAGLRGRLPAAVPGLSGVGRLDWHAGLFRTTSDDDIQFVSSPTVGRAFFRNVGKTRRQGVEAGLRLDAGRLTAYAEYAFTDATFRTPLTLSSEDNPAADAAGEIHVRSGDRLPGIPRHTLKFGADYAVSDRWSVGAGARVASGQVLFGDEANQNPKTDPYVVLNLHTAFWITPRVQVFGLVENVFNNRYETYGTFSPTSDVPMTEVPGASNPRSLSPAPPIAGFGGLRVLF